MCFFIPPTHFMSLKKLMLNLSYQRLKLFLVFCYFFTEYHFFVLHFLFFSPHKIYTTLVMSSCIDLELLSGVLFVCFHLLVLLVFFFVVVCLFPLTPLNVSITFYFLCDWSWKWLYTAGFLLTLHFWGFPKGLQNPVCNSTPKTYIYILNCLEISYTCSGQSLC